MTLLQYPQEKDDSTIASKIIELEHTAWPEPSEEEQFPSAPNTYATSFVWLEKHMAICHVGIRKCTFLHRGESYLAYGLSEVVTHPSYQNQGLASKTIQKAAQFIISQQPDLSIFTCEKHRVPLYEKGGWRAVTDACLIGGTAQRPFRSDALNLITMMMLISPKAKQHKMDFRNTDISLELGENQLW